MNTDFRYFPLIMQDIVSLVASKYDVPAGLKPYYEFGTYLELVRRISIKDRIEYPKYPLVWLVWEANESQQQWNSSHSYNVSPRLFICNFTSMDYSSSERYTANFIAVLFPIWELLKQYIQYNTFVSVNGEITYQLAEHLLWGESLGFQKTENVLFDTLDAIEIKLSNLEVNKRCV